MVVCRRITPVESQNTEPMLTFPKGGTHPPELKEQTAGLSIEIMVAPDELELILGQHIGAPCTPTVSRRAEIAEGSLVGEVKRGLGVPLHSPVAGKIMAIGTSAHPMRVTAPSLTIGVDHEVDPVQYVEQDYRDLDASELLQKVNNAGITGVGGAGFATHVKLNPPAGSPVDILLLNGAECEPYITSDHRQMLEHAAEIVGGAEIILKILGISECHIGIEANKPDAIKVMTEAAEKASGKECSIKVRTLEVNFPIVNPDKCVSCGICVKTCPKSIIELQTLKARVYVPCSTKDLGKNVKQVCQVGCIGCKMCVKACPAKAVTYEDNLIKIDHEACIGYGSACETACVTKWPRDIFRDYRGPLAISRNGVDGLKMAA